MKLVKHLHFAYSAIIGLVIGFSSLAAGINPSSILATLIFLPITLYFIFEIIKISNAWRYQTHKKHQQAIESGNFLFSFFLTQEDPYFMITLGLFSLVVSFSILRFLLFPASDIPPVSFITQYFAR